MVKHETEIAVIGGGLVGMAVAFGLRRRGRDVTVFDEGDHAFRAARGNFGLIWVQGKGATLPDYARWTRYSAEKWPDFAQQLGAETGIDLELSQPGGFDIFLNDTEAEVAIGRLDRLRAAVGGDYPFEFVEPARLRDMIPEVGPAVVGAIHCPEDGHVNPLYLLRALTAAFLQAGGIFENGASVMKIEPQLDAFTIHHTRPWRAGKIVLCAGLGNTELAPMLGLQAAIRPERGQILVTERVRPFLKYPTIQIRQTGEGALQIGASQEDVGLDDGTSAPVISEIANRACQIFPLLEQVRMVRCWAALRVMSADGCPIYQRSQMHPGATLVNCHSGVTLAAAHASALAAWIDGAAAPELLESFSAKRFDVLASSAA
jgi:glycine/D-amino acid oxidase-like deaminating enzyme